MFASTPTFKAISLAALALLTRGVAGDKHVELHCVNQVSGGYFVGKLYIPAKVEPVNDATTTACLAYRADVSGNGCADCVIGTPHEDGTVVCSSPGNLLDGDKWTGHCEDAGADDGAE